MVRCTLFSFSTRQPVGTILAHELTKITKPRERERNTMSRVMGQIAGAEAFRHKGQTRGPLPPVNSGEDAEHSDLPQLDQKTLRDGYSLCLANARRLISDARALQSTDRYTSAHLLVILALEELGSAIRLYEAARVGVQDWEGWWRKYFRRSTMLESMSLGIAKPNEEATPVREELAYVTLDKTQRTFRAPHEERDRELFKTKAAYAERVLRAMPLHAFELLEIRHLLEQEPAMVPSVLYTRIEELISQNPNVSTQDLLNDIARDLAKVPEEFAAGYGQWKRLAPKARACVDLLERVQGRIKKQRETRELPV